MTLALLGLSRREREVFELALHDLSNKEIADKLFIAEATVKNICKTF
jgi:ATP/maltotriose-dependent transcriptional regulator MalT